MKKIGTLILLITIMVQAFSQKVESKEKQPEKQTVKDSMTTETVKIAVGDDKVSIEDNKNGVKIRVGDQGLTILESLEGGKKVKLDRYSVDDDKAYYSNDNDDDRRSRARNRFSGNWWGIEFGFNSYMVDDFTTTMPEDIYYMTIHSGKSNNFSINFVQQSIGFSRHCGLVTGLGLEWNNYRFDGNNNIEKNDVGQIVELDPGQTLKKSRFKTLYLNVPVLFQGKIHVADHSHLNIAGGIIGGVKLWSQTKMVTADEKKLKTNTDLSLNVLRWGPTLRIGFGNFQMFGTYYFTPLFKSGKGPGLYNLYPCEVGFALTFSS